VGLPAADLDQLIEDAGIDADASDSPP